MQNNNWHTPSIKKNVQASGGSETQWQCVFFGRYPQTEVFQDKRLLEADWQNSRARIGETTFVRIKGAEGWRYFRVDPIQWRILDCSQGQLLLICDQVLDVKPFHEINQEVTWENCTLRSWLNGYAGKMNRACVDYTQDSFLINAFTPEETADIVLKRWENPENYYFGTSCGNDTEDRVVIPAEKEILFTENAQRYGFSTRDEIQDGAKQLLPTAYAAGNGVWTSKNPMTKGQVFWFTRTSGYTQANAVYMDEEGCGYNRGIVVSCQDAGILPMICVRADSIYLKDAGTCSSLKKKDVEITHENCSTAEKGTKKIQSGTLTGPVITKDEKAYSGQRTIWNTLYFGRYPMTEILKEEDHAVDDYAEDPGDYLILPDLYEKLINAVWTDNVAEVDNELYFRARACDTRTGADRGVQHYQLQNTQAYHYFRYDPIRWRILENDGEIMTLVADRALDCRTYHETADAVDWENCSLRAWLNGELNVEPDSRKKNPNGGFLHCAFDEVEQQALRKVQIKNEKNIAYGTSCGGDTEDYVHLLSQRESFGDKAADYGFYTGNGMDDNAKRFRSTRYAKFQGTWWSPVEDYKGNAFWFMRNSGYSEKSVSYICDFGYIYNRGTMVDCNDAGILPVIHLDAHNEYVFAGTVCSEDILRKG